MLGFSRRWEGTRRERNSPTHIRLTPSSRVSGVVPLLHIDTFVAWIGTNWPWLAINYQILNSKKNTDIFIRLWLVILCINPTVLYHVHISVITLLTNIMSGIPTDLFVHINQFWFSWSCQWMLSQDKTHRYALTFVNKYKNNWKSQSTCVNITALCHILLITLQNQFIPYWWANIFFKTPCRNVRPYFLSHEILFIEQTR